MSVDSSNWDEERYLVITPTDDADTDNEEYVITVGYTASVPEAWMTLRQLKGEPAIVEEVAITIRVTDDDSDFGFSAPGSTPEGEWVEVTVSLVGAARGTATTLQFSSDIAGFQTNPDSGNVVIDPGDYDEHSISIRYEGDDFGSGNFDIAVTITDLGLMSEKTFTFNVADDDRRGLTVAGITDNDLGVVSLGRERNLTVRLLSEPFMGIVAVTVGHASAVTTMVDGTDVPITVSVTPLALTFNAGSDTWEVGLPLTLAASTDSMLAVTIDYTVTLGVDGDDTTEFFDYATDPITLSMMLQSFGFLEFRDPPAINEGDRVAIRFSRSESRESATRLRFSSDTALPDSGMLGIAPSEYVIPANNTLEHVVMVTYDDDLSNDNDQVINVVVTNLDDMSETTSYPLTFMDDDTAGLLVGGELVTGGMASLGELRINRAESIDVRLNTRPTDAHHGRSRLSNGGRRPRCGHSGDQACGTDVHDG